MSLDGQLRAALNQEADMLNAPAPDMDRLISGGRARRRRRTLARTGIAAALVAVLVGGGAYGVMQIDSGTAVEPAQPPSTTTTPETFQDLDGDPLEPGTYRWPSAPMRAASRSAPTSPSTTRHGMPTTSRCCSRRGAMAGWPSTSPPRSPRDGCSNEEPNRDVADSPQALAEQLALLPRSTVAQPPAPAQAFGRDAVHLRLRIDNDCGTTRYYRVAESELGAQHGISYNLAAKEVVIDFWVVDVDGDPVVVDVWHEAGATTRAAGRDRARSRLDHLHALSPAADSRWTARASAVDDAGVQAADATQGWFSRPTARAWVGASGPVGARAFHRGLPAYAPTPLVSLPDLAASLGVAELLVKDESSRLGLPAFKVLGASWAVARLVAGLTGATTDLPSLRRAAAGSGLRLVTATDGNHGRAVAHMAALLGLTATVFVPDVMTAAAAEAIVGEGADVVRTDADYDAAVVAAAGYAAEHPDRRLVQDTAWPGYEQVPAWIVEGYDTMLEEVDEQLGAAPDLVAVPVGVGSLAQAVVSHYRRSGSPHPALLSVEPDSAACVLASLACRSPGHGGHGGDRHGRAELRHRLDLGLAGAAGRLRRRGHGQRCRGTAGRRGPGPPRSLVGSLRRRDPGRRAGRPRRARATGRTGSRRWVAGCHPQHRGRSPMTEPAQHGRDRYRVRRPDADAIDEDDALDAERFWTQGDDESVL